jgi:hypothetical protein
VIAVAIGLVPSYIGLSLAQGATVAAPVRSRRRGGAAAIGIVVPVAALGLGVGVLRAFSAGPDALAILAAVGTPLLAACSGRLLGWRPPWATALAAALFFLLAWQLSSLVGEAAGVALIGLACLTVAAAVATATSRGAIETGLVLLAIADLILVWGTPQVEPASTALAGASLPTLSLPLFPDRPLPSLQQATFGSAQMGWLDLLAPALLGAVVVPSVRRWAALATAAAACAWGLLLVVTPTVPATVPVLAGLLVSRYAEARRSPSVRRSWRTSAARTRES